MTDIELNDGRRMPQLGMGTYQLPDAHVAGVVRSGLDLGFRLVDTAAMYHNERGVGEGLSGSDAWVTTKLWHDRHRDAAAALDESLALLGRDSVDLYLIHWPHPAGGAFVEAWKTLVALRKKGKARSIGVSNFLPEHVRALVEATGVTPAVNQIELHPTFQQRDLVAFNADHGIATQCWSPLGQGDALTGDVVEGIARRHDADPAQIVIAWHLAKGLAPIPKAGDADHLASNAAAASIALSDEDIAAIDALDDPDGRMGPDPRTM